MRKYLAAVWLPLAVTVIAVPVVASIDRSDLDVRGAVGTSEPIREPSLPAPLQSRRS